MQITYRKFKTAERRKEEQGMTLAPLFGEVDSGSRRASFLPLQREAREAPLQCPVSGALTQVRVGRQGVGVGVGGVALPTATCTIPFSCLLSSEYLTVIILHKVL